MNAPCFLDLMTFSIEVRKSGQEKLTIPISPYTDRLTDQLTDTPSPCGFLGNSQWVTVSCAGLETACLITTLFSAPSELQRPLDPLQGISNVCRRRASEWDLWLWSFIQIPLQSRFWSLIHPLYCSRFSCVRYMMWGLSISNGIVDFGFWYFFKIYHFF